MSVEEMMQWAKDEVWLRLYDHGESAVIAFVLEPFTFYGQGRQGSYETAAFPVMTDNGLRLFRANRRLASRIAAKYADLKNKPLRIIRVGQFGSFVVDYKFKKVTDSPEWESAIKKVKQADVDALLEKANAQQASPNADDDEIPV